MIAKHLVPHPFPIKHQRVISNNKSPISNLLWIRHLPNPRFLLLGGFTKSSQCHHLVLCVYDIHVSKAILIKNVAEVLGDKFPLVNMVKSGSYIAIAQVNAPHNVWFYSITDLRKIVSVYKHSGNFHSLAINKRHGCAYISDYTNQISIIDIPTGKRKSFISLVPHGQARGLYFSNIRQKLVVTAFMAILIVDVKKNEIEHVISANKLRTNLLYGFDKIIGATSDFSYVIFKSGELEDAPCKNYENTRFFHYLECYNVESRKVVRVEVDMNPHAMSVCSPATDSVFFMDSRGSMKLLRLDTLFDRTVKLASLNSMDHLKDCLYLKHPRATSPKYILHSYNKIQLMLIN